MTSVRKGESNTAGYISFADLCFAQVQGCELDPCLNGGTCTAVGQGSIGQCSCACDYEGRYCETRSDPCSADPCAHAVDTTCAPDCNGEYTCQSDCEPGFQGSHCDEDVNECSLRHGSRMANCDADQFCHNLPVTPENRAGYECTTCPPIVVEHGQPMLGSGLSCAGIWNDLCIFDPGNPCELGYEPFGGNFQLQCMDSGWVGEDGTAVPVECRDINECERGWPAICDHEGTCADSTMDDSIPAGQFRCTCTDGWEGETCNNDIDECAINNGGCDDLTTCQDQDGMFVCGGCPAGYVDRRDSPEFNNGRPELSVCVNVNECENLPGPCWRDSGRHDNLNRGYELRSNCTDLSPTRAEAERGEGQFRCSACPPGLEGNGLSPAFDRVNGDGCIDIDECQSSPCTTGGPNFKQTRVLSIIMDTMNLWFGSTAYNYVQSVQALDPETFSWHTALDGTPAMSLGGEQTIAFDSDIMNGFQSALAAAFGKKDSEAIPVLFFLDADDSSGLSPGTVDELADIIVASEALQGADGSYGGGILATCNEGVNYWLCPCLPGFTGARCFDEIDECASYQCQHDSVCTDLIDYYTCTCLDGFEGEHCEFDIDECSSSPCMNGATCIESSTIGRIAPWNYECQCPPGFVGHDC
eukprot:SAG31_NODE_2444_length_5683_cov_2.031160_4_plen_640_part_01